MITTRQQGAATTVSVADATAYIHVVVHALHTNGHSPVISVINIMTSTRRQSIKRHPRTCLGNNFLFSTHTQAPGGVLLLLLLLCLACLPTKHEQKRFRGQSAQQHDTQDSGGSQRGNTTTTRRTPSHTRPHTPNQPTPNQHTDEAVADRSLHNKIPFSCQHSPITLTAVAQFLHRIIEEHTW